MILQSAVFVGVADGMCPTPLQILEDRYSFCPPLNGTFGLAVPGVDAGSLILAVRRGFQRRLYF